MRIVQGRIQKFVRGLNIRMPHATAVLPGTNPRKNVLRHRGNRFFYLTDISDAFGSVELDRLVEVICALDGSIDREDMALALRTFCFVREGKRGLVTGGLASQDLFNVYAAVLLDQPLGELAKKHNLRYTRFLDDLTFSGSESIGRHKRRAIRECVSHAGMRIGHHKSKVYDLAKGPIVINGIGIASGWRKTFTPKHYVQKLLRHMHHVETGRVDFSEINRVNGMMGAFLHATGGREFCWTRTEMRVLKAYRRARNSA
jgi:hypothetical protein